MIEPDIAQKVLSYALSNGGDFAEIFAEDRTITGISLDDGRVEELSTGSSRGAGIRVIKGSTSGYAHCADLSEESLLRAAQGASAVAKSSGKSKIVEVPVLTNAMNRHSLQPAKHPGEIEKAAKVALLNIADQKARDSRLDGEPNKDKKDAIRQVSASYGDSYRSIVIANSEGLYVTDTQTRTRFSVSCVAIGDTGLQTGYESVAETVGFELFDKYEVGEIAKSAAARALVKLDAIPAPSGEVPVVLAGGSGGILFHEACGHGLEADHINKEASVYTNKIGQKVASPLVTLVDDGTIGSEWGTYAFDDEGNPSGRTVLIENGVLVDYMYDHKRAKQAGKPTWQGNGRRQSYQCLPMVRMTNTFLLAGTATPEEIISDTPYGIYVAKLGGGQVNTVTGDFVFGTIEAYLIENGKITSPLRDTNLIGNGPDVLSKIDAVANDFGMSPGTCGKDGQQVPVGCGQATLRITGVTIGGTTQ
ncbi:MAG: TldD/PmbA family protein [Acidimicrobiales bacterium]|nr:TldD/PmbA family protein [Acidimicrobiales bacterium]